MANITIRSIPESVFAKLKLLSEIDRRSLNNELLIAIECGLAEMERNAARSGNRLSSETQIALWGDLAGKWKDQKPKAKQIKEIYAARTMGRDVSL
jgi:hypothetical protein